MDNHGLLATIHLEFFQRNKYLTCVRIRLLTSASRCQLAVFCVPGNLQHTVMNMPLEWYDHHQTQCQNRIGLLVMYVRWALYVDVSKCIFLYKYMDMDMAGLAPISTHICMCNHWSMTLLWAWLCSVFAPIIITLSRQSCSDHPGCEKKLVTPFGWAHPLFDLCHVFVSSSLLH